MVGRFQLLVLKLRQVVAMNGRVPQSSSHISLVIYVVIPSATNANPPCASYWIWRGRLQARVECNSRVCRNEGVRSEDSKEEQSEINGRGGRTNGGEIGEFGEDQSAAASYGPLGQAEAMCTFTRSASGIEQLAKHYCLPRDGKPLMA